MPETLAPQRLQRFSLIFFFRKKRALTTRYCLKPLKRMGFRSARLCRFLPVFCDFWRPADTPPPSDQPPGLPETLETDGFSVSEKQIPIRPHYLYAPVTIPSTGSDKPNTTERGHNDRNHHHPRPGRRLRHLRGNRRPAHLGPGAGDDVRRRVRRLDGGPCALRPGGRRTGDRRVRGGFCPCGHLPERRPGGRRRGTGAGGATAADSGGGRHLHGRVRRHRHSPGGGGHLHGGRRW